MLGNVLDKIQKTIGNQAANIDLDKQANFSDEAILSALVDAGLQLEGLVDFKPNDLRKTMRKVLDIDEVFHNHSRNLTNKYLIILKNNLNGQELEEIVYGYLNQLYKAYQSLLASLHNQAYAKIETKVVKLVLARYLNAAFMMTKWRYFDQQPAPTGLWQEVHKVIKSAEKLSIVHENLFLYDNQRKETTIAAILERGFMLDTLQREDYTPIQIELTERILRAWSSKAKVTNEFKENAFQFFIHLDADCRPQRLRRVKPHPDFRYWSTLHLIDLIEEYLCAANLNKPLDSFNLVAMAPAEDIVRLFKKLRIDWCVQGYQRQRRADERKPLHRLLDVSYGIDKVTERIQSSQSQHGNHLTNANVTPKVQLKNKGMQTQAASSHTNAFGRENWQMLEESSAGFSVEVPKALGTKIKSGGVMAYSILADDNGVRLAEVKSIRKRADNTYRIGLAKLPSNAAIANVSYEVKTESYGVIAGYEVDDGTNDQFSKTYPGVLIDRGAGYKPKLMLPRNLYKRALRYKVEVKGVENIALAGRVLHSHRDWVCFELVHI